MKKLKKPLNIGNLVLDEVTEKTWFDSFVMKYLQQEWRIESALQIYIDKIQNEFLAPTSLQEQIITFNYQNAKHLNMLDDATEKSYIFFTASRKFLKNFLKLIRIFKYFIELSRIYISKIFYYPVLKRREAYEKKKRINIFLRIILWISMVIPSWITFVFLVKFTEYLLKLFFFSINILFEENLQKADNILVKRYIFVRDVTIYFFSRWFEKNLWEVFLHNLFVFMVISIIPNSVINWITDKGDYLLRRYTYFEDNYHQIIREKLKLYGELNANTYNSISIKFKSPFIYLKKRLNSYWSSIKNFIPKSFKSFLRLIKRFKIYKLKIISKIRKHIFNLKYRIFYKNKKRKLIEKYNNEFKLTIGDPKECSNKLLTENTVKSKNLYLNRFWVLYKTMFNFPFYYSIIIKLNFFIIYFEQKYIIKKFNFILKKLFIKQCYKDFKIYIRIKANFLSRIFYFYIDTIPILTFLNWVYDYFSKRYTFMEILLAIFLIIYVLTAIEISITIFDMWYIFISENDITIDCTYLSIIAVICFLYKQHKQKI